MDSSNIQKFLYNEKKKKKINIFIFHVCKQINKIKIKIK